MKFARISALTLAAAATVFSGSASAVFIQVGFNFNANSNFTADTGDVTNANTISGGGPFNVAAIAPGLNNINLIGTFTPVTLSLDPAGLVLGPLGVNFGDVFYKTFTTSMGTFLETLKVNSSQPQGTTRGVTAIGTITQTSGTGFDPTPVYYSASYTQNPGSSQINGSFNNSTVAPVTVPEPASLALVGLALAGIAASRKSKKA